MKINYWQNFEHGCYYHIYNHAVSDHNIFTKKLDYEEFLSKHFKYLTCAFETIAYCMMPNHFHFVVKVKSLEEVLFNSKNEISKISELYQEGKENVNAFILDQ